MFCSPLSEHFAMSFQVGLFCELSFQKIATTLSFVFFVWSVPDVALALHFLLCSVCPANEKKLCFLFSLSLSHQSNRLWVALLSPDGNQTKTSFLIFSHIWEKGWRGGGWCQLQGLDGLFPKPLTPFREMLSDPSVERPQWCNNSWISVVRCWNTV